jgi:hypothetical protein
MLCILEDKGRLTIGNWWYRLGPGIGARKTGGDGERMGWSGVWVDGVDGVGSGTLAGSTCIGDGGRATDTGAGASTGAVGVRGAGAGAGTGGGAVGVRVKEKFEGPGL